MKQVEMRNEFIFIAILLVSRIAQFRWLSWLNTQFNDDLSLKHQSIWETGFVSVSVIPLDFRATKYHLIQSDSILFCMIADTGVLT